MYKVKITSYNQKNRTFQMCSYEDLKTSPKLYSQKYTKYISTINKVTY